MKWRNLISYRDRLYTSNANIDVFELWTIWFVITKWKLEMGMSADCGDHVQICAIIALYIYISRLIDHERVSSLFFLSFLLHCYSHSRIRVLGQIIVSLHFSFHLTSYSIILIILSFRCTYSDTFFQNPCKRGFNMVWTIPKHVSPWFLPC